MDSLFGFNMQKSGFTIALLGFGYLKKAANESFLERWIARFIQVKQRFFEGTH